MKIKNYTIAVILSLTMSFTVSPVKEVKASGFPTIDVASITQALIDYLLQLKGIAAEVNTQIMTLMQLQEFAIPGTEIYENFMDVYTAYHECIDEYNKIAESYNELSESLKELEDLDALLKLDCIDNRLICTKKQYDKLQRKKKEIFQKIQNLNARAQAANDKMIEQSVLDLDTIKKLTLKAESATTVGEQLKIIGTLTAKSLELMHKNNQKSLIEKDLEAERIKYESLYQRTNLRGYDPDVIISDPETDSTTEE